MQKDMHFYGTYALARAAGIPPEQALVIATSAQFVDEAETGYPVKVGGESYVVPVISAHSMMDKANVELADQWKVWLPYHFLPGGVGGIADEKLICRKGEPGCAPADAIIELAVQRISEPYGAFLLGIVTHVVQDTYSHYGFSGISSDYNQVEQGDIVLDEGHKHDLLDEIKMHADSLWENLTASAAEEISSLGHGAVGTYPDRPFLNWSYEYEMSLNRCPRQEGTLIVKRQNAEDYLQSCKRLFSLYAELAGKLGGSARQYSQTLSDSFLKVLNEEKRQEGRIQAWKDAISSGQLFDECPADVQVGYTTWVWKPESLKRSTKSEKESARLFYRASWEYRHFVLGKLLPDMEIL